MIRILQMLGYIVHEWHTRTFKSEDQAIGDLTERLERQWAVPCDEQLLRAIALSKTGHIFDIRQTLIERSDVDLPLLVLCDRLKRLVAEGKVEATDCTVAGKCVRIRYQLKGIA